MIAAAIQKRRRRPWAPRSLRRGQVGFADCRCGICCQCALGYVDITVSGVVNGVNCGNCSTAFTPPAYEALDCSGINGAFTLGQIAPESSACEWVFVATESDGFCCRETASASPTTLVFDLAVTYSKATNQTTIRVQVQVFGVPGGTFTFFKFLTGRPKCAGLAGQVISFNNTTIAGGCDFSSATITIGTFHN